MESDAYRPVKVNTAWRRMAAAIFEPPRDGKLLGSYDLDMRKPLAAVPYTLSWAAEQLWKLKKANGCVDADPPLPPPGGAPATGSAGRRSLIS